MATIPVLPIEQLPEVMQTVQMMSDVNPDGGQLDNAGVKLCLSQIAKALHSTVVSLVTVKNSVMTETSTADVAFKKLEMSVADLCAKTDEINGRLPSPPWNVPRRQTAFYVCYQDMRNKINCKLEIVW